MNPLILLIPESIENAGRPAGRDRAREDRVLRQIDAKIEGVSRPHLVLDCSRLRNVGLSDIHLLVACLERILKRNGDVRLSCVSADALESLSQAGVDRLFLIYASREDAAQSFRSHLNVMSSNDGHRIEMPRACTGDKAAISSRPLHWVGTRESGERDETSQDSQEN